MWLNVGVSMHPAELFGVGVIVVFADYGPAVKKVLDCDEQQAEKDED